MHSRLELSENNHHLLPTANNDRLRLKKNVDLENLYVNGRFNNTLWRSSLNNIISKIDFNNVGITVISPFGFEVMQDERFLKSTLRRFYCYIGIPNRSSISRQAICHAFETELFTLLSLQFTDFYNDIVLKVIEDNFIKLRNKNYICCQSDKLIDIQCRYVNTSILDDYADYIICSLSAIFYGKDEPREFPRNSRFRNRTYQLYVMLERLFGCYIDEMNQLQKELLNTVYTRINNAVDYFYDDHLLYQLADELDKNALNVLIMPRISKMMHYISQKEDMVDIQCKSYHVNDELKICISKKKYDLAKNHIITSYQKYT